jgi:hypothetical protein
MFFFNCYTIVKFFNILSSNPWIRMDHKHLIRIRIETYADLQHLRYRYCHK